MFNKKFDEAYDKYIIPYGFNEGGDYYKRHRYRYYKLLKIYDGLRKDNSIVLDIGGGQLGLLAHKIYGDKAVVADIGNPEWFKYLNKNGVSTESFDLCTGIFPSEAYDVIFFAEVLEHLPVPARRIFEMLKASLKPTGTIICCVPNLTALENIFSFIFNIPVFAYFQDPNGKDLGHVIMYTKEHLEWQIKKAGFKDFTTKYAITLKYHRTILRNILFFLGFPLFIVKHFRHQIIAIIRKDVLHG
jgi:2-polyprenyl-3-methyl-5-hydroxy-6-metoxy-1,4-benzoquinol methylase